MFSLSGYPFSRVWRVVATRNKERKSHKKKIYRAACVPAKAWCPGGALLLRKCSPAPPPQTSPDLPWGEHHDDGTISSPWW